MTVSSASARDVPRPLAFEAWARLQEGAAPALGDLDATCAGLVGRWHQHLAVAIDPAIERAGSGAERLPELVDAFLDLALRTAAVRRFVAAHGGPRTEQAQLRQDRLLATLLAEDLSLVGHQMPEPAAAALVRELVVAADAEQRVGHRLPATRAALLRSAGLPAPTPTGRSLACRLGAWRRVVPSR